MVAEKKLSVGRVVRVACRRVGPCCIEAPSTPMSVLKWALDLAQVPVVPELVEFLGEVARRRADPTCSPARRADPDSPLVQWSMPMVRPSPGISG